MEKTLGIIGAMAVEVDSLKKKMAVTENVEIAGMRFLKGRLGKTDIIIAQCGIGKVFAAACTQAMIMRFSPDYILNIGVCGSLTGDVKTGDIILGERALQYDMDTSAVGDPVGLISGINKIYFECSDELNSAIEKVIAEKGINYKKGVVATGDRFISSSQLTEYLRKNFDAVGGDMESGAIGHVCYINGVEFSILRAMSDSGDESADTDYKASLDFAVKSTVEIVSDLCK